MCISIYVYPLLFNKKITNNFVQRNIWVTTELDYNTSNIYIYMCVTFKFTVYFPALLTGSLEIAVIFITSTFQSM